MKKAVSGFGAYHRALTGLTRRRREGGFTDLSEDTPKGSSSERNKDPSLSIRIKLSPNTPQLSPRPPLVQTPRGNSAHCPHRSVILFRFCWIESPFGSAHVAAATHSLPKSIYLLLSVRRCSAPRLPRLPSAKMSVRSRAVHLARGCGGAASDSMISRPAGGNDYNTD